MVSKYTTHPKPGQPTVTERRKCLRRRQFGVEFPITRKCAAVSTCLLMLFLRQKLPPWKQTLCLPLALLQSKKRQDRQRAFLLTTLVAKITFSAHRSSKSSQGSLIHIFSQAYTHRSQNAGEPPQPIPRHRPDSLNQILLFVPRSPYLSVTSLISTCANPWGLSEPFTPNPACQGTLLLANWKC